MVIQALGLVWIKRLNVRASALAITTGSLGGGDAAVRAGLADRRFAARLPPDTTLRAGAAIVYLGVLGSVVGFTLYYYVIRHLDAGRVALIMLVTPVAALLLGQTLNARIRIPAGRLGRHRADRRGLAAVRMAGAAAVERTHGQHTGRVKLLARLSLAGVRTRTNVLFVDIII
jgi:hypothetical protein